MSTQKQDKVISAMMDFHGDIEALSDIVKMMPDEDPNYHVLRVINDRMQTDYSKLTTKVIKYVNHTS